MAAKSVKGMQATRVEREARVEQAAPAVRAAKAALAASLAEPVKPVNPANLENQADLVSPGNPVSRARPAREQCGRPIRNSSSMRNTESSKSGDPAFSARRDVLHKIGVTPNRAKPSMPNIPWWGRRGKSCPVLIQKVCPGSECPDCEGFSEPRPSTL